MFYHDCCMQLCICAVRILSACLLASPQGRPHAWSSLLHKGVCYLFHAVTWRHKHDCCPPAHLRQGQDTFVCTAGHAACLPCHCQGTYHLAHRRLTMSPRNLVSSVTRSGSSGSARPVCTQQFSPWHTCTSHLAAHTLHHACPSWEASFQG
jgi:hypothetical protein